MNSVFKKVVTTAAAFSMLATSCISGYAAQITQDTDFSVKEATSANSYTATVGVKNDSSTARSFDLITAVYSAGATPILTDVDLTSCEIAANTSKEFYTGGAVTVDADSTVRVFAWDDELSPLENGTDLRTLRRYATLSAIKIGDYATVVDNQTKCIYVDTNADISAAGVSGVVVSDGATYVVADNNASVTVTSEDELTTNTYKVVTSDKVNIVDFEDSSVIATSGAKGTIKQTISTGDTSTIAIEADPKDESNQVYKIDDYSTTANVKASFQYNFNAIEPPYAISYKVMFSRNSVENSNVSGTWLHARYYDTATKTVMSMGAQDGTTPKYRIADFDGERNTSQTFERDTWHEMKMECISEDEVNFYVDGELIRTGKPINYHNTDRLVFFASSSNAATIYFDDICVRPYYLGSAELESVSFTNGADTYNAYIHDGTIYVNAASLEGLNMGDYSVKNGGTAVYDATAATVTTTVPESGTTPAGQSTYKVVAKEYFEDDFESYDTTVTKDATVLLEDGKLASYYRFANESANAGGENATTTIGNESGNQILTLTDNDGNGSAGARAQVYIENTSAKGAKNFVVEYRVKHDMISGTTYVSKQYDVTQSGAKARGTTSEGSNKELAYIIPTKQTSTSDALTLTAKVTSITASRDVGQWYKVKIVYTTSSDGTSATAAYYIDDALVGSSKVADASLGTFSQLYIATSAGRQSVMSIDDIKILSLD
ncbi:MAG: hypothetical protein U0L92_07530 [Clostridia bacterium]|nr:hypothetical protein [Clostridia bacterium]